jgi:hypothetical protein
MELGAEIHNRQKEKGSILNANIQGIFRRRIFEEETNSGHVYQA